MCIFYILFMYSWFVVANVSSWSCLSSCLLLVWISHYTAECKTNNRTTVVIVFVLTGVYCYNNLSHANTILTYISSLEG